MNTEKIYHIISTSEFANSLQESTMKKLSKIMHSAEYSSSSSLYTKGESVLKFIFIYSGSCNMVNEESKIIRNIKKGDFFGLISLFTNSA